MQHIAQAVNGTQLIKPARLAEVTATIQQRLKHTVVILVCTQPTKTTTIVAQPVTKEQAQQNQRSAVRLPAIRQRPPLPALARAVTPQV